MVFSSSIGSAGRPREFLLRGLRGMFAGLPKGGEDARAQDRPEKGQDPHTPAAGASSRE